MLFLSRYWHLLLALLVTTSTLIFQRQFFHPDIPESIQNYQKQFHNKQKELKQFLKKEALTFQKNKKQPSLQEDSYGFFVFEKDSLIYWNSNHIPIHRYAEPHFPGEGLVKLQNGWYYAETQTRGSTVFVATLLLRHAYSYENNYLQNSFSSALKPDFQADLVPTCQEGNCITNLSGQPVFSLIPSKNALPDHNTTLIFTLLLLSCVCLWLYSISIVLAKQHPMIEMSGWFVILVIRWFWLQNKWFSGFNDLEWFQATLYGANDWFPNFFELLVNACLLYFVAAWIVSKIKWLGSKKSSRYISALLFVLIMPLYHGHLLLVKGLVENSTIPLQIDQLFKLSLPSFFTLAAVGLLFLALFKLTTSFMEQLKRTGANIQSTLTLALVTGGGYGLFLYFTGKGSWFEIILPTAILGLITVMIYRKNERLQLGLGMGSLAMTSLLLSLVLSEINIKKEKGERELYANQLATEQDIVTEVEYNGIVSSLRKDRIINKIVDSATFVSSSSFKDGLERRIFHGFWERYELDFLLFDGKGVPLISGNDNVSGLYGEYNDIIRRHGKVSEIDPNIFYIIDYTRQFSYVIRQPIETASGRKATLFVTLKSKKIPEEIGFPRLLISKDAKVFSSLENYSIARYHNGRLVKKFGRYNFPTTSSSIPSWKKTSKNYKENGGYTHYVLRKENEILVLSTKNITWREQLTSFSYIFCYFGLLLIPQLFHFSYIPFFRRGLTLSTKIQLILIGLVFLSLLAFSYGSGLFVSDQYGSYSNDLIRQKLASVELEIRNKLGTETKSTMVDQGNRMEYYLGRFAKVFVTDINVFDASGFLLASSRPKLFQTGLLSEQMNPVALHKLTISKQSEFVHQEQIGSLQYISAYAPLYNNQGELLGYMNLQQFGQQQEFEIQIQQFLVSIFNVFMVLLALSVMIALLISNWVTSPLRQIQESFKLVSFGKKHEKIAYEGEDEIGALVRAYNIKLEELEKAAEQLAANERESAWRDMAKQVAHEIKNPLTPMKLSAQHLLRTFDPNDPKASEKIEKVVRSLIEQIDALTRIANEFSNFAKMPAPHMERIDIAAIVQNVMSVFSQEENCILTLSNQAKNTYIEADKDQMLRVFNNLIKNAIQAIPSERLGKINIVIASNKDGLQISISDNGKGMTDEQKNKLFVPYFTTKSTGSGLGLAMVKQIIENHGGEISFNSRLGEGSTFDVRLYR